MRVAIAVISCVLLSGCGIFTSMHDRSAFVAAKNAYVTCLTENSRDVSPCAGLKKAYEVNLEVYEAD